MPDLTPRKSASFTASSRTIPHVDRPTNETGQLIASDEYYGSLTPLNQVATLTVADPRLITVRPWEKTMIPTIEKGINQADIGINPSNDGEMIRLPIPPLSGERRKELVRQVRRYGEDCKQSLRNHRRDANEMLREAAKESEISEDDRDRGLKRVQQATDAQTKAVDDSVGVKEAELLEV